MGLKDTISQKIAQKAKEDELERQRAKIASDESLRQHKLETKKAVMYWLSDGSIEALIGVHMNYPLPDRRQAYFLIRDGKANLVTLKGKGNFGPIFEDTRFEHADNGIKLPSTSFVRDAAVDSDVLKRLEELKTEGISVTLGLSDNQKPYIHIDYSSIN